MKSRFWFFVGIYAWEAIDISGQVQSKNSTEFSVQFTAFGNSLGPERQQAL